MKKAEEQPARLLGDVKRYAVLKVSKRIKSKRRLVFAECPRWWAFFYACLLENHCKELAILLYLYMRWLVTLDDRAIKVEERVCE